jgi:hypothetical protein
MTTNNEIQTSDIIKIAADAEGSTLVWLKTAIDDSRYSQPRTKRSLMQAADCAYCDSDECLRQRILDLLRYRPHLRTRPGLSGCEPAADSRQKER